MTSKYSRSKLLILLFCLGLSVLSNAQTPGTDSLIIETKPLLNVAYGVQPTWMVTGAISTISGADVQTPFTPSFSNKLSGRIPGLTVLLNGAEPGNSEASIFGRGINTFSGGQSNFAGREMLILVDGMEFNYEDLVPEEVESISLLKDASATAMYGSRGANGVLLITSKRGKPGKLKVEFGTQQGFQQAYRLPEYLGSYDYATLYNEALVNDGKTVKYAQEKLDEFQNGSNPFASPDVNWYKQVLRDYAPISNYNLNFSGGNSTVRYFVLLNQVRDQNLYRRTGDESEFSINGQYKRFNFRSNVDVNLSKRLSAEVTMGATITDNANPAALNTSDMFTTMSKIVPDLFPVRNADGTFARSGLYYNPLAESLNKGFFTTNGRTIQAIIGLTEQLDFITKGLSATARVAFSNYFLSVSNKQRTYVTYIPSIPDVNGIISYTKNGAAQSLQSAENESKQNRNTAMQFFLNYDRTFGIHALNGVLMYNEDEYLENRWNNGRYVENLPYRHNNMSGRATYGFKQKYIGEFSFSYMGSENYKKYGFFPAASLGWIVSNEDFLKNNSAISFLKIRGSYGLVGNDKIGGTDRRNLFDQRYPGGSQYWFGTTNVVVNSTIQGSPANADVSWEKEKSVNLGIEATIMNHFDVAFDVFNRDRYDILVQPNTTDPDFIGVTKPYLNLGKTNNKGFEVKLRIYNNKTGNIKFFVEPTVSYFKNKVVFQSEAIQSELYMQRTGQPIDQPFGLVALGLFQSDPDIANNPKQIWKNNKPGDIQYQDRNIDGKVNELDVQPIGKTGLPNLTGGMHLGLEYKGFDLDMFWQAVTSRTVYFGGYQFEAFQNNGKVGTIALDRWSDTNPSGSYPRLSAINDDNNFRYSSFWQRDGSFLKLRTLEMGYTIPNRISEKILMQNARIYISGTNLLSIDNMAGYRDPEVGSGYPVVRTFSVGLRVQIK